MSSEVLTSISASTPRRILGVGILASFGALILYMAGQGTPSLGWGAFMVALGLGAIWLSTRMWQATKARIDLTDAGLISSDGTMIVALDEIVGVERGVLATKPSNGFVLRTKTAGPRQWQPGLWWRLGRRVGIGGVTPGGQSKTMSELIAVILADRDIKASKDM